MATASLCERPNHEPQNKKGFLSSDAKTFHYSEPTNNDNELTYFSTFAITNTVHIIPLERKACHRNLAVR